MGKNDFLTPKAIANRIKAKGLTKLRWYCQMCQKPCRDENGFKCHLTSDSHKRQMEIFGQAPDRVIEGYSEEFETTFLEHLRRCHPFSRVSAKNVYNEYIADRHHVHMNSTKWLTLTEFVKYLGREGKCTVDQTPKGWFIKIVQPDPAGELTKKGRLKRDRAEMEEEERHQHEIEVQMERAKQALADAEEAAAPAGSELKRDGDSQPLAFSVAPPPRPAKDAPGKPPLSRLGKPAFGGAGADDDRPGGSRQAGHAAPGKRSKLEELMEVEQTRKRQREARDRAAAAEKVRREAPWVVPGIVVKVVSEQLKEHGYYKKKGVVDEVVGGGYVAVISMLDSGDVLQVDQAQLQTVLPQPGGAVRVLAGTFQGANATLQAIDMGKFKAQVEIKGGTQPGHELWLEYEEICKINPAKAGEP